MINSLKNPIEIELSDTGKNLDVFFSGIAAGIAIPPFEFFNVSRIINEHKIFIRDFSQSWYQDGLPTLGKDINSTAEHIKGLIENIHPDQTYFVGNSMGGFAAILFSHLIGVGDAMAFAPQTFISPWLRVKYRDRRWMKQILSTYWKSLFKRKVWDLRPLLIHSEHHRKVSIFVSKANRLDYIHACHLADIPGVNIFKFDGGHHEVVKLLRDQGELPAIMAGDFPGPEASIDSH